MDPRDVMRLSAPDVEAKTFREAWRGYDQREVDDFLDRVAEALTAAERALRKMGARLAEAGERARRSEEEAARRVAQAEAAAAADRVDDLVAERRRLERSIARLERFRADLKLRLAAFLEGQAQALEQLTPAPQPGDDLGEPPTVVRLEEDPEAAAKGASPSPGPGS